MLGMASDVTMEYHVLAVGFDNAEGTPSNSVRVVVPDISIPEPPSITAASGADGKSQINFTPALPATRSAQFLVLRSGSEADLGVVIGDPLAGDAREFTDLYVSPGESYWYRLVAVGANGNRSDPTQAVAIRVGSPSCRLRLLRRRVLRPIRSPYGVAVCGASGGVERDCGATGCAFGYMDSYRGTDDGAEC